MSQPWEWQPLKIERECLQSWQMHAQISLSVIKEVELPISGKERGESLEAQHCQLR